MVSSILGVCIIGAGCNTTPGAGWVPGGGWVAKFRLRVRNLAHLTHEVVDVVFSKIG